MFLGLDVVVPLISEDLLKIPKLCRLYFGLLGYMLEAFPERMAALPGAHLLPGPGYIIIETKYPKCPPLQ